MPVVQLALDGVDLFGHEFNGGVLFFDDALLFLHGRNGAETVKPRNLYGAAKVPIFVILTAAAPVT